MTFANSGSIVQFKEDPKVLREIHSGRACMGTATRRRKSAFDVLRARYLRLRQAQFGGEVGPLGQSQVLGLLEALVEGLQLQTGVNGPRLSDLLAVAVEPQLAVFQDRGGLVVFCLRKGGGERLSPRPRVWRPALAVAAQHFRLTERLGDADFANCSPTIVQKRSPVQTNLCSLGRSLPAVTTKSSCAPCKCSEAFQITIKGK